MNGFSRAPDEESAGARTVHDLPGPRGLPLVGNLLQIDPIRVHRQMLDWAREFGTPYRIRIGPKDIVVWDDARVFQQIARERPGRWRRGGRMRPVAREMGFDGLLTAEGSDWERQRRLVMGALNPTHLRGFFPTLQAITARLHRRWSEAADAGRVVEMTDDLMRYTVDVTCALAFGEDPDTLGCDGDRIQHHLAEIFPGYMRRLLTPWSYWRWFRLPRDRRLDRSLAAVHAHVADLVARARGRRAERGEGAPAHLLDALLDAASLPDSGVDDAVVAANVLTLLLAGEDTTAHSLAWTLPFLASDPAMQDRLHAEARAALGESAVCPGYDALRGLDLCEAAVNEAQRLQPVIGFLSFDAVEACELGGLSLPKDARIYVLMEPAQHDGMNFHEPARYDPDRWLRPREAQPGAHEPRGFLQFGAGPRVCPGRHLAGVEMRLVVSMLARSFRVELACERSAIRERCMFTIGPDRMPVRLHRR
jgi:cytochrome P450